MTSFTAEITIDGQARWSVPFRAGQPIQLPPGLLEELAKPRPHRVVQLAIDVTPEQIRETLDEARRLMSSAHMLLARI